MGRGVTCGMVLSPGDARKQGEKVGLQVPSRRERPTQSQACADRRRKSHLAHTYTQLMSLLVIVLAYLLGSVNFGVLMARTQGVDIYSAGSGNPGTSNVMRVLGKKLGALVLVGDAAKGAVAAAIGVLAIDPAFGYVALLAAVVGHAFPVWHRFRGGKSVATTIGGMIYLAPAVGLVLGTVWIVALVVWKTASIGSLVAMGLLVPLLALTGRQSVELVWSTVIALFVILRHTGNIQRLVSASERKVS